MASKKKVRIVVSVLAAFVVLAGVSGVVLSGPQAFGARSDSIPTVRVKRGNLELKVYTTGELRPAKSMLLMAPQMGGTLQIVTLARTGDLVKAGDLIAEFDPSEQEYNLERERMDLLLAEQEITKAKADAAVQTAQDKVALLQAKFAVRRAELDVSRNELLSAIDGKKNLLNLEEAKRRLEQLEHDVKSRTASSQAGITVLEEKRNRARLNMLVAKQNIDNMTLKAPSSGLVSIKEAQLNFYFDGMVIPDLRAGDIVWPGRAIAEIMQVEEMEILAKVSENDRANINPGQAVEVRLDAKPDQPLSGRVKTVGGMAAREMWWRGSGTERKFDATFTLDRSAADVRPGTTANIIIVGDKVLNALFLPRQAVFDKDGRPVVYVRNGEKFDAREVKIQKRTESQVAVEGVKEGDEVALVNPETRGGKPSSGPAPGRPAINAGAGK
ncbi:MAG: efflux RND transporter periplasmic adaptor subunit [Acidobacteria bacterium]|nr:efflux RND transporter periplasmic adaptor subunit [Acidobacteriota bacterium]MBI3662623.1 efflux RND transporter periplasmic adaptor subunit [Acidobacteriota bacterium]